MFCFVELGKCVSLIGEFPCQSPCYFFDLIVNFLFLIKFDPNCNLPTAWYTFANFLVIFLRFISFTFVQEYP